MAQGIYLRGLHLQQSVYESNNVRLQTGLFVGAQPWAGRSAVPGWAHDLERFFQPGSCGVFQKAGLDTVPGVSALNLRKFLFFCLRRVNEGPVTLALLAVIANLLSVKLNEITPGLKTL